MADKTFKPAEEWLKQSEYDLDTAVAMLKSGRYIYTVSMCHLAVEKALKGLYARKFNKDAPKIHNLNYFCEILKLAPPENFRNFIDNLNSLSIPARYPDELEKLLKDYRKDLTEEVLKQTEELLSWLKKKK